MIGPVDVLAVMDEAALSQAIRTDREYMREARAAVAELIEADKEYDRIISFCNYVLIGDEIFKAKRRREAALARCTGDTK